MASVNFAADPVSDFDGFWGACSTYGSFSYLKYGPFRLLSQMAQDCDLRLGTDPLDRRDTRAPRRPTTRGRTSASSPRA